MNFPGGPQSRSFFRKEPPNRNQNLFQRVRSSQFRARASNCDWVMWPGAHPLWVSVSSDSWSSFGAKFGVSRGRQVWALSTRSRSALRLSFSLHSSPTRRDP